MSTKLKGIYALTDPNWMPTLNDCLKQVEQALRGGICLVQYRNKLATAAQRQTEATALHALCSDYQRPLIINDHLELAVQLQCGVHLGQSDGSLQLARETLGPDAIIGATCHNSLEHAERAIAAGASYIAFGSLFPSKTKPQAQCADLSTLSQAKARWPDIPVTGIGGITLDNLSQIKTTHADLIAVVESIWNTNNIEQRARALKNRWFDAETSQAERSAHPQPLNL